MAHDPAAADPPAPRRTIGLRWSLYRNLVLLVLVVAGSVYIAQRATAERTRKELSAELLNRAADQTESAMDRYLGPVTKCLRLVQQYVLLGVIDPVSTDSLNHALWPLMTEYPQISSVSLGDPAGYSYTLLHFTGGWVNRTARPTQWGDSTFWQEWSPDREFQREYWRKSAFDPRARHWFRGAAQLGPGEIYWSEPYTFFTTQQPGITAAIHIDGGEDGQYIAAFDVLLSDISAFTQSLRVSPGAKVAVLTAGEHARILGLPADSAYDSPVEAARRILRPAASLPLPEMQKALELWNAAGRGTTPFRFDNADQTWWAGFRPYQLGQGPVLWVAVLVPESDFLGAAAGQRTALLGITAGALALAILLALALARTYSRPLRKLARAGERLGDLDTTEPIAVKSRLAEVQILAQAQERARQALDAFARYVPVEVVRELLRRGEAGKVGGRQEIVTVLFTDVAGFTEVTDKLPPEELARHLSEYFELMLGSMDRGGATLDKFMGDAVMAFWGGLRPTPGHAVEAVSAVLTLREALRAANRRWESAGKPVMETRFGLASGEAVVGNIGSASHLAYTALGDTVNLAARMEGLARHFGVQVLAAERTVLAAGDRFLWRELDRIRCKGRTQPVAVYELLGVRGEVDDTVLAFAEKYARALSLYRQREFRAALRALNDLGRETDRLDDRSLNHLRAACESARLTRPGDWQPVSNL